MINPISSGPKTIPQNNSSGNNKIQQIDQEIMRLQEQIESIKSNDKISPEEKEQKIKDLQDRIANLQERKIQEQQKAQKQQSEIPKENTLEDKKTRDIFGNILDEEDEEEKKKRTGIESTFYTRA